LIPSFPGSAWERDLGIKNRLRFRDEYKKMSKTTKPPPADKTELYRQLADQLQSLLAGESDLISNAANTAALIYYTLPDINWAGFYFLKGEELVLGPFQGKPACVRIPLGKGVCGTAAKDRKTLVVPDVQKFPGHIACDTASNSEIVVPLIKNRNLLGVLDVDSPTIGRFDVQDQKGLEHLTEILIEKLWIAGI
jgi:L-methionine (R)-S-oxide reductase